MKHWLNELREELQQHDKVVLVTVALIRGSTPREAGAHMIVSDHGFKGTIGGGNLEFKAIDQARDLLSDGDNATLYQDYPLGPALGQCCGGVASLLFETVKATDPWVQQASEGMVTVSSLSGEQTRQVYNSALENVENLLPAKVRVVAGNISEPTELMEEEGYFLERVEDSRIPLYLYGAGHVAHALVSMLVNLPFKVTWIDNRSNIFGTDCPSDVDTKVVENQEDMAYAAPNGAFHLVMTHDHGIDLEITHAVLAENRFGYIGVIGSDTKRARFERRLNARGIDRVVLEKLNSPIGIPEITGKQPGEVALSVAAEMTILYQQIAEEMNETINEADGTVSRMPKQGE
ncbi:xanthine dehydrogenase accessory protein XdhC [Curvivirga sp.]|uniref:xanthine dehydrogenase accessory protein XdhC n=1 Tax=Curvivirga sp. TaxID=2856848 RepID=UPI003B59629C